LILLDIEMPEMDGFEALRRLKTNELHADIPVIFLTSMTDASVEVRGFQLGVVDFITKPFSAPVLLNRIKTHLNIDELIRERTYLLQQRTEQLQHKTTQLQSLQNGIVFVLADMVENRDHGTGGHVERTARYIKILIDAMLSRGIYADEIEKMDLKVFIEAYADCIKGNEHERQFLKGLEVLKAMDFTSLWEQHCLPFLNKQCDGYNSVLKERIVSDVLSDIQKMKPDEKIDDINIYLTYFSWPVAFQLSPTSYLTYDGSNDSIDLKGVLRLFAHELLHGVSNEKTREIYRQTYQTDELLKKTTHVLFVKQGSPSDEEEFVVAIDHYVSLKNGLMAKDEAYQNIFHYYKSTMPVAVIVFDELVKLGKIPEDINSWIYDLFINGTIEVGEIETKVNSILPGYADNFMKIWFKDKKIQT